MDDDLELLVVAAIGREIEKAYPPAGVYATGPVARAAIAAVIEWQRKQLAQEPRPPIFPAEWLDLPNSEESAK